MSRTLLMAKDEISARAEALRSWAVVLHADRLVAAHTR